MGRRQFRVLYREFLFRMVDLEVLSFQGDIKQLLGQFGSILVCFSAMMALGAMFFSARTPREAEAAIWGTEHFLIATTMLVMGLFSVLSWDSTFPDHRDVLVLSPLPIQPRTLFLAKAAALGAALGLTTAALNALPGITWGLFVFPPPQAGLLGPFRALAAYWIASLAGAAFMFCGVLAVQGIVGQLLRRLYLRLSAILQIAVFCAILAGYFMEPPLATPWAFAAPQNQEWLAWLPSYWFLGLLQALKGNATPGVTPAAWRGVLALMAAAAIAAASYLLAYLRTLRKIVEEPDIAPAVRGIAWLPNFGNRLDTAVVQFSVRTLLRSRQHRIILAFYLGIGFAILILLARISSGVPEPPGQPSLPLLLGSVLMLAFWVLGTRAVFALPLELRANWIFRVIPIGGPPECLRAGRRALLTLSAVPLWLIAAAICFCVLPWRAAAQHLLVIALLGAILCEACLQGFRKVPFTCSYLPGKSRLHMAILAVGPLIAWTAAGVVWERRALNDPVRYGKLIAVLAVIALAGRLLAVRAAQSSEASVRFEEEMPPVVQTLGLRFEPTGSASRTP